MTGHAIGVIAGRGGSRRLPGKNVMLIGGKPVIAYTIEAALKAGRLGRVIVSTDDDTISQIAIQCGVEVVRRPSHLAVEDSPIDDAYRHVLAHIEQHDGYLPEIVVGMQANVPIRKKGEIDEVVQRLDASPWATAVATARHVSERPEWMKILKDAKTGEITALMDAGVNYRKQDLPDLYLLDGAAIAIRSQVLRNTSGDRRVHAYLGDRVLIHLHESWYSVEIDEAEDVELAEHLLSRTEWCESVYGSCTNTEPRIAGH